MRALLLDRSASQSASVIRSRSPVRVRQSIDDSKHANVTEEPLMTTAPAFVRASNPLSRRLLQLGTPMGPNVLLTVRGRTSGLPRSAAVAVVESEGRRYVTAPTATSSGRATCAPPARPISVFAAGTSTSSPASSTRPRRSTSTLASFRRTSRGFHGSDAPSGGCSSPRRRRRIRDDPDACGGDATRLRVATQGRAADRELSEGSAGRRGRPVRRRQSRADLLDRHRPFADRRRDALHRSARTSPTA